MRIGLVRYLNARPLDYGLRQSAANPAPAGNPTQDSRSSGADSGTQAAELTGQDNTQTGTEFQLIEEIPSRLFQMLSAGELDAALISSVECLRNAERFGYCPSVGVCARDAAYSIVYIRRRDSKTESDPDAASADAARRFARPVRRILADAGSRSSIALLQSLYFRANGVLPSIEIERPEHIARRLGPEDGGLLIGDGALEFLDSRRAADVSDVFETIDLGRWWRESEDLPFVFALWAYPRERPLADELFEQSLAAGEREMDRIIDAAERDDARRYLTQNLHYRIGPDERRALERFRQRLTEAGLLDSDRIG